MRLSDFAQRVESAWDALRGRDGLQLRGAYTGALINRLNADWIVAALPSDQELITDLKQLRTRSRDLGRNDPFCGRFLELVQENMIGPDGIDLRPMLKDPNGQTMTEANRKLHDAWLDWTDRVSLDGQHAMTDFCHIGATSLPQDGEIFVRKHIGRQFKYGLALQYIDPDLADESYNLPRDEWRGTNEVRLSVEVSRQAARVGYHFYDEPGVFGSRGTNRHFVPAGEVLHIGRARRIHQTRFVPWFHPVMDTVKMLNGLVEAELVASRAAAAKMGFIVTKSGQQIGAKAADGTRSPVPMQGSPGALVTLPMNTEFQGWDPTHPTTAFPTFHAAMIRRIAAGLSISYTSLANDPGDANYGSARGALQMEQRFWRKIQQIWCRKFMQPIFDEWLRTALLTGDLDLGFGMTFERVRRVRWEVPGWEWLDPKDDVQSSILAINANLDSPQRIASLRGLDFEEDIIEPKKEARRLIEEAGLAQPADAGGAAPNADTQTDPEGDGSASSGRSAPPGASRNGKKPAPDPAYA